MRIMVGLCLLLWLRPLTQRSSQWVYLAGIFPFPKSERGGKRGSINPDDCWGLGVNPRFHVLFQRCRQGQNDADKATKISTIDIFLPNFTPLGCEGSRGSHLTTRLFTRTAAADRPRAGMPAPLAYLTTSKHVFSVWWWRDSTHWPVCGLTAVRGQKRAWGSLLPTLSCLDGSELAYDDCVNASLIGSRPMVTPPSPLQSVLWGG